MFPPYFFCDTFTIFGSPLPLMMVAHYLTEMFTKAAFIDVFDLFVVIKLVLRLLNHPKKRLICGVATHIRLIVNSEITKRTVTVLPRVLPRFGHRVKHKSHYTPICP